MIKRALVSGGNGFIGSNVCRVLRTAGVPVRALVLPQEAAHELEALGVEVVRGDITEPLPATIFDDISHVFHLAAIAIDWGPDALFERVNVGGTRHMIEAAVSAGVERFIHISSLAVHRYSGHSQGDEHTPCDGDINAYCRSKRAAEDVVRQYSTQIHTTVIRPGVVPYGPGDQLSIPGIVEALQKGIYRHVGGGHTRVCLSYVENLATGIVQAAQRQGDSGEAFVLCDDVVSWRAFVDAVAETFDVPIACGSLPLWLAGVAALAVEAAWRLLPLAGVPPLTRYRISLFRGDLMFSADKARAAFGYQPAIGLREGLCRTRVWLEQRDAPTL